MKILPKSVTLNKTEGYLEIIWNTDDDRVCRYPLSHLREACPCVQCRGGHHMMGQEHEPKNLLTLTPARSYKIIEIHAVGNYAIQPAWDDGHDSGIYTWDFLWRMCPDES